MADTAEKKKICFVVQRYGMEVNGGAETYCRELAEKMLPFYDVSVFTTKAIDYMTWANAYTADREELNGIHVFRFPVEHPRVQKEFDNINVRFMRNGLNDTQEEDCWFEAQGPYSPQLLEALRTRQGDFDAFVMCTYLYYQTVYGTPIVKDKAILVPMAHDEPFMKMQRIRELFKAPRAFFFLTEAEKALVLKKFGTENKPCAVGGAGVDAPENVNATRFVEKYGLTGCQYVLYAGRIDKGKGCDDMFRYWKAYKKRNPGPLKLVLMGKSVMPVPQRDDILNLGFVSEEDKFDGMAGARLLLLPSQFESLSIVVLESMSMGVPVLVNGRCEVLKDHCTLSNAGLYYTNYMEFEATLNYLLTRQDVYAAMCKNAPDYVNKYYRWDNIVKSLANLIENPGEGKPL